MFCAVFLLHTEVQQTMKTATSDEELAFKQKEREMAMYTRKVQHLVDADLNACDAFLAIFSFLFALVCHYF